MLHSGETINSSFALFSTPSRLEKAGNVLALSGFVLLVVAPSTVTSALSLALLATGLALQPSLGLALLGVVLPFYLHPKQLGSMDFSLPELILLSTLLGAALHAAIRGLRGARVAAFRLATPLDGPVALFLGAALLSLLASEVMRVSLRDLRTLVLEPVAAYYLAVWFLRSQRELVRVVAALLLGGAIVALFGLYQYFFTDQVTAVEGVRRIQASYSSPNNLGLYLGRLLPVALAMALFLPAAAFRSARIASGILSAILAAALLFTFSIGSWLATALAILVVVLLWRTRAGVVMAGGYLAALAAAVPLSSTERVSSHFSLTRGTSFIRIHLWESSLQMIRDHPLLGVGMDNFLYHYRSEYLQPEAAAEPNLSHPHNLVLNFWLQMGILGVAAAAWVAVALGQLWRRRWRVSGDPLERALLAGIAGSLVDFVVHGMVDNSYFLVDLSFHFWLCAAIIVVLDAALSPRGRIE